MHLPAIGLVVVLAIGLLFAGASFFGQRPEQGGAPVAFNPNAFPEPKPGREIYTVSSSEAGPRITTVVIDGFDAPVGAAQGVSVRVTHESLVASVMATMKTDGGAEPHPLKLTAGSPTDGTWEGDWAVANTHLKTYGAEIKVSAPDKDARVNLTFK